MISASSLGLTSSLFSPKGKPPTSSEVAGCATGSARFLSAHLNEGGLQSLYTLRVVVFLSPYATGCTSVRAYARWRIFAVAWVLLTGGEVPKERIAPSRSPRSLHKGQGTSDGCYEEVREGQIIPQEAERSQERSEGVDLGTGLVERAKGPGRASGRVYHWKLARPPPRWMGL